MAFDRYGRPLTSARISITHRCNLDCVYCHSEGVAGKPSGEMTPEEITRITALLARHGVSKVKLTGGEPLVRRDVCDIVSGIADIEGIMEVSMTTNGIYLDKFSEELREAGLRRVNVSLDTLNRDVFTEITRVGDLSRVLHGVESALEAGLKPVKLNMVVMSGINEGEIHDMLRFSSRDGVILQLIELMVTGNGFFREHFYDLDEVEAGFERVARGVVTRKFMQGRRKYLLNGAQVEVVKPMHNTEFCSNCSRIRVTADGKFKPCLMRRDNLIDFLSAMRDGASDDELEGLFGTAMHNREPFFKKPDTIS
ncbi:MAG: GTP 3',8-cyclase MoaA [Candidatus Hydrothermarchaeaceae archaeon]